MRRFLVLFSSLTIILSSLLAPIQKAAAESTADQYCINSNPAAYEVLKRNGVGSNYRQAFTPTQNRINSVAVKVGGNNVTGLAILRVFTAPTGFDNELLRADRNFTNLSGIETWYFNDFGTVTLNPGTTYYISLTSSVDFLYWYSVDPNGCAPSGMAWKDGVQMGYKLHYSTFGFTETSSTPATTAADSGSSQKTAATTETLGEASMSIVKPTSLTAEYSDAEKGIKLAWKASTTASIDGYKVFRSESSDKGFAKVKEVGKDLLNYTDQDIAAGKTYYYQVRAFKTSTQSYSSNTASAKVPDDIAPAKPKNLSVVDSTEDSLTVRWAVNGAASLKKYTINLYKGNEKIRTNELPPTANTYSFLDLEPGIMYKIELIAASNTDKESSPAVTFGTTSYPAIFDFVYDSAMSAAIIGILILLLILSIRTLKYHKKKS